MIDNFIMEKVKNHSTLIFILWICIINLIIYNRSLAIPLSPQSKVEIDSLLLTLPESNSKDRFDIYVQLSNQYLSYSMDTSRIFANLALLNARKTGDLTSLAVVYKLIGSINYYQGNYNSVIALLRFK